MVFPELFNPDTSTDFQVSIDLPVVPVVSKQRPDAQVWGMGEDPVEHVFLDDIGICTPKNLTR